MHLSCLNYRHPCLHMFLKSLNVILQGIFTLSYGRIGIEIIPGVIQAIADKKEWLIKNFVNSIGDTFVGNGDMNLYINCNDNIV